MKTVRILAESLEATVQYLGRSAPTCDCTRAQQLGMPDGSGLVLGKPSRDHHRKLVPPADNARLLGGQADAVRS